MTATLNDESEGRLLRAGRAIVFFTGSDSTTHACGSATVTNTRRIEVTGTGSASKTLVTVDESGGRLAPGARLERTRFREIEVRISVIPGDDVLALMYVGTAVADRETVGANGLDLNSDGDLDVTTTGHPFGRLLFAGLGGRDRLSGGGSAATGAAVQVPMRLVGGPADDLLRGGAANDVIDELGFGGDDVLVGRAGNDLLRGAAQNDRLRGGGGTDELYGGGGYDSLYAADGLADTVRGGSAFDEAWIDEALDDVAEVENFF